MEYITQGATAFSSLINVSLDIFVLIGTLLVTSIVLWKIGKGGALSLLLSLYLGGFLYSVVVNLADLSTYFAGNTMIQLGLFVVLYILTFIAVKKFIHGEYSSMRRKSMMQIGLLTISTWGILYSFLYTNFALQEKMELSPVSSYIFLSENTYALWLLFGVLSMYLISRR